MITFLELEETNERILNLSFLASSSLWFTTATSHCCEEKVNSHTGPHKYIKVTFKSTGKMLFRCGIPGCTHNVHEGIILGRNCLCWRCNDTFTITAKNLKTKYFHCVGCTKTKIKTDISENLDSANKLIDEILGGDKNIN